MHTTRIFFFALLLIMLPGRVCAQINVVQSVLTQRNDVRRTGSYPNESVLTPSVVSSPRFKRLAIRRVEGQIAGQALYVSGVTIAGVKKNVLYVVTRKNMIYAFDADNVNQNDPRQGLLWANPILLQDWDAPGSKQSPLFASPLSGMDDGPTSPCRQTHGPVGITSTPVIDPVSQVMYLVARFGPTPSNASYGTVAYYYLVALDIRTGQELRRVQIQNQNPIVEGQYKPFNPGAELNRPGLLLLNNVIYVAFGAPVCDSAEYKNGAEPHGWVFAYSTLPNMNLLDVYNTSPQNELAGIWQSGTGLAADPTRHFVYALTGNNRDPNSIAQTETGLGTPGFDDLYHPTRTDLGESILKLSLGPDNKFQCDHTTGPFCVTEHFTAGNWYRLDTGYHSPAELAAKPLQAQCIVAHHYNDPNDPRCVFGGDSDLGSGGAVVLSNGWVLGGGKQGRLYVLDPNDMKHAKQGFFAAFNTWHQGAGPTTCTTPSPVSEPGCVIATTPTDDYDVGEAWGPNIHGSPAVWERPSSSFGFLYLMAEKDYLRAYRILKTGQIVEQAEMTTASAPPPYPKGLNGLRSPDGMPGGAVSASSNGDQNGIVWVSVSPVDATYTIEPGILMAFDALTLKLLWFDDDPNIYFAKFVPPTIAGGKVFRATFGDNVGGNDASGKCTLQSDSNLSCGSIVIYGIDLMLARPPTTAPPLVRKPNP